MSWPEAVVSIVSAICFVFLFVHVVCDGISVTITIRHKHEDNRQ